MGFKRLDAEDFLVSADAVSSTVWTSNSPTLSNFYTSSAQVGDRSGDYYYAVYQETPTAADAEVQFDIAFADKNGRGSLAYNPDVSTELSYSRTIYGQYRSLVLEDEDSDFSFGGVTTNQYFYVLSINRARYKEKLLPGSLNLSLAFSGKQLQLTDNSKDVTLPTFYGTQRAFQLVSGSGGTAYDGNGYAGAGGQSSTIGSYGLFLPDTSTIILNGAALDNTTYGLNLNTNLSANTDGLNPEKLFSSLSQGSSFTLNSEETISSDFIFIRSRNSEFNYSENPSFIKGSTGEVVYDYFIDNPQVYPTTVGLYNDQQELLAVAKLSKPIKKDKKSELNIRVKLDY